MEELNKEGKNIGQIRFEFDDGTWFILDHMSIRHVKPETKLELDFAISKVYEEIEEAGRKAREVEESQRGKDLGIDVNDDVGLKDVGPGQM